MLPFPVLPFWLPRRGKGGGQAARRHLVLRHLSGADCRLVSPLQGRSLSRCLPAPYSLPSCCAWHFPAGMR